MDCENVYGKAISWSFTNCKQAPKAAIGILHFSVGWVIIFELPALFTRLPPSSRKYTDTKNFDIYDDFG